MSDTLRCLTSVFLSRGKKMLMLYRQGGKVVNDLWIGSAGGHLESKDQNDTRACVLRELQEELNLSEDQIRDLTLK